MVKSAERTLSIRKESPQHALFPVRRLGREVGSYPERHAPVHVDPLETRREPVFRHQGQPRREERRVQSAPAAVAAQSSRHFDHAEPGERVRKSAGLGLLEHLLHAPDDAVLVLHHLDEAVELAGVLRHDEDFEQNTSDFYGAALEARSEQADFRHRRRRLEPKRASRRRLAATGPCNQPAVGDTHGEIEGKHVRGAARQVRPGRGEPCHAGHERDVGSGEHRRVRTEQVQPVGRRQAAPVHGAVQVGEAVVRYAAGAERQRQFGSRVHGLRKLDGEDAVDVSGAHRCARDLDRVHSQTRVQAEVQLRKRRLGRCCDLQIEIQGHGLARLDPHLATDAP